MTLQTRHVLVVVLGLSAALAVTGFAAELAVANGALPAALEPFAHRFLLDAEGTIPAWYSSTLLLLCGLLLAAAIVVMPRQALRLGVLAAVFVVLSADESAQIHEMGNGLMQALGAAERHNLWVVPGIAFVLVVGVFCLGLLRDLPSVVRRLYVLAAVLFVAGAVGMEVLALETYPDRQGLPYIVMTTLEETLEMAGVSVFLYAQARLFREKAHQVRLHLR